MEDKLYVVRSYIKAKTAKEAIKKSKAQEPDDVWIDEEWKKQNDNLSRAVGFNTKDDKAPR